MGKLYLFDTFFVRINIVKTFQTRFFFFNFAIAKCHLYDFFHGLERETFSLSLLKTMDDIR